MCAQPLRSCPGRPLSSVEQEHGAPTRSSRPPSRPPPPLPAHDSSLACVHGHPIARNVHHYVVVVWSRPHRVLTPHPLPRRLELGDIATGSDRFLSAPSGRLTRPRAHAPRADPRARALSLSVSLSPSLSVCLSVSVCLSRPPYPRRSLEIDGSGCGYLPLGRRMLPTRETPNQNEAFLMKREIGPRNIVFPDANVWYLSPPHPSPTPTAAS